MENKEKKLTSVEVVTRPAVIDRGTKAINTSKELNKRLHIVKLMSQNNLFSPTRKRLSFALTKTASKSHEVNK